MALSVPLSRFTSRVGGGSAFFVRMKKSRTQRSADWKKLVTKSKLPSGFTAKGLMAIGSIMILAGSYGCFKALAFLQDGNPAASLGRDPRGLDVRVTDYLARSAGLLVVGIVGLVVGFRKAKALHKVSDDEASS